MAARDSATESAFTDLAIVPQQTLYLATPAETPGIPASDHAATHGSGSCGGATRPPRGSSCLWLDIGCGGRAPVMYGRDRALRRELDGARPLAGLGLALG